MWFNDIETIKLGLYARKILQPCTEQQKLQLQRNSFSHSEFAKISCCQLSSTKANTKRD